MSENKRYRLPRTTARRRRWQRRRMLRIAAIALAAIALLVGILLWIASRRAPSPEDTSVVATTPPTEVVEASDSAGAEVSEITDGSELEAEWPEENDSDVEALAPISADGSADAAPETSGAPAETEPPARPVLTDMPNVLSFYHPKDKSYSPRVRYGDTFSAKWKKGDDIGSFEVIASDADACKIGFTLRYTLDDGSEIKYSMLAPQHIEHTEYIECWLYDDYHREPHQFYSHIKKMGANTLITSIKLTSGQQIDRVQDIWLTAFVCSSLDDFDAERNYLGDTSCTLHITRE
ncbi:MAG: hypothetical protein IKD53_12680 [Clostridia bacterium]|nr:hypothetical protein [Clostridia bacterium]